MYLVKNKDSGEVELIGSISAIAKHTGIKSSSLYQQFSRHKKVAYIKDKWEIEKKTIIKSKRNGKN